MALAISTGIGALASLLLGKMFDRAAMATLVTAVVLSSIFSPFVFLGGFHVVLFGLILWGIGYATQDKLLKALVAGMLPEGSRSLAFGLYYAGYAVGWAYRRCGYRPVLRALTSFAHRIFRRHAACFAAAVSVRTKSHV